MLTPLDEEEWLRFHGDRNSDDIQTNEEGKKYIILWDGFNKCEQIVFVPIFPKYYEGNS